MGRGEERGGLGREPLAQRLGAGGVGLGDAVELGEGDVGMRGLPQGPRLGRGPRTGLPRAGFEAVGGRRALELAGRSQPREQVVGRAVEDRAAQQAEHAAAEGRVARGETARECDRDPRRREDVRDQRRALVRAAEDDRDLLGREALLADQPRDVGRDELELGPLAATLEQDDPAAGVERRDACLEQAALEVMEAERPA